MKSGGDFPQKIFCAFSVAPCVGCLSPSPISLPVNLVGSGNKEDEEEMDEEEDEEGEENGEKKERDEEREKKEEDKDVECIKRVCSSL